MNNAKILYRAKSAAATGQVPAEDVTGQNGAIDVYVANLLSGEVAGFGLGTFKAANEYETVAASQTDQILGGTGALGDYLEGLLIVPSAVSPGAVSIKDGSGSAITVYTGGATITTTQPTYIELGIKSTGGAWKVTTGTNVSVLAMGNFT